jgi:gamma-glutamyl-gamma-aminobutyrate hydrolase PuuD
MGCCLDFPFDEKSAMIEYFNVSDCAQNSCHYRVGLIANHKIDMCCDPWRVRLFQESFCGLQAEVLTIPIAPTIGLNDLEAQEYYRKLNQIIDVAIFAGGDDIDPELFSQKNYQSKSVNALRDVHEQLLLFSFLRSEKTFVAGVCRGHQLILSTLIEDCCLIQDLSKDLGISDHDYGTHKIEYITTAPFIDDFYHSIPELVSNSLHHQAFIDLPHDGPVVVNACDSHGIIEGTVFKNLRGMTVQFHPEKMPYVANAFARSLLQGAQSLRAHQYS